MYGLIDFRKAAGAENGIIVTRDTFEQRNATTLMPAALFLFLT